MNTQIEAETARFRESAKWLRHGQSSVEYCLFGFAVKTKVILVLGYLQRSLVLPRDRVMRRAFLPPITTSYRSATF